MAIQFTLGTTVLVINGRSMNPYSYIMNNPLAGTDPSGYASSCISPSSLACQYDGVDEGNTDPFAASCVLTCVDASGGNGSENNSSTSSPSHDEEVEQLMGQNQVSLQPEGTIGKGNIPVGSTEHQVLNTVSENPFLSFFAPQTYFMKHVMSQTAQGKDPDPSFAPNLAMTSALNLMSMFSGNMLPSPTEQLISNDSGALAPVTPGSVIGGTAVMAKTTARLSNVGASVADEPIDVYRVYGGDSPAEGFHGHL